MKITQFFLDNNKLTNFIIIFIFLIGAISIFRLPRQDTPNVDFNILTIATIYPGASPEDVEVNVTDPIEDELEKVDGIEEMSSFSIEGMSFIYVQISPDVENSNLVKEDVKNAVDRVSNLPIEIEDRPLVTEMKSTDFPILEIAIMGDKNQEEILRKIAKDIESDCKAIGNVGDVVKIGYRKREVKILCDAKKMEKNQISFSEILNAIRFRNVKVSGGTLESYVDEKKIITFSEFEELLDVKDVIIRSNFSGKHIRVSDIAEVRDDYEKKYQISRTNGMNSLNLIIKRRGTTDVIRLSKKIDEIVNKYKDRYESEGIQIAKVVDYTYYTKSLLNIVANNALIGFCLVVISLFLFLNFHSAFWVGLGIPISILGAYIFFPFFDVTTNQITLITMIMVLGMIVDDAIVIAENINRHQEEGMSPKEAALIGTAEVFRPVLATILTTILCFTPIFFMSGILGKFIVGIPIVVILTLLMSLFESVSLLPYHLSHGKADKTKKPQRWMNFLKNIYGKILSILLKSRFLTLFIILSISVSSFMFFKKHNTFELFPTEDFDLFYIVMETKMGDSLKETASKVKKVEGIVSKIPDDLMMGYKTIVGDHQTDEAASDPAYHEHWALITVFLHPASERYKRSEKIIEELNESLKKLEGFQKMDVREMQDGPPVGAPITVRLVSDDFALCKKYSEKLIAFLKEHEGVYDIETSDQVGKDEIRLKLDHDFMAKVGINALELANTIRLAYDGKIATTIRRNGEEIDFRVQLKDEQRSNFEYLKELQILNRENRLIKINQFVTFDKGKASQTIVHFSGKKAIIITGKVKNEIINASQINKKIKEKFEKEIAGIPGLSIFFGGEEKETMKSMQNFVIAFLCALFGIYFILVLLLDSYFQPFLIMVAIPFGFIGVMAAFYIHHLPLSFLGIIGSLGMMGVVVNDSLVMVTYLNQLKKKYNQMNSDIIIEGAKTRLRPVLLTTITTVLGLLPTVYGWGGTEPFIVPLVLSMSWGLVFATSITLFLIPTLYTFTSSKGYKSIRK